MILEPGGGPRAPAWQDGAGKTCGFLGSYTKTLPRSPGREARVGEGQARPGEDSCPTLGWAGR